MTRDAEARPFAEGGPGGQSATATTDNVPDWADVFEHDGFSEASVGGARRERQLRLAADLIACGRTVEPRWVRVQLLDLADLLDWRGQSC